MKTILIPTLLGAVLAMVGCDNSSLPPTAEKSLSSHVDTSLSPQQRIEKIQNNPGIPEAQKASLIQHIKQNNHLN